MDSGQIEELITLQKKTLRQTRLAALAFLALLAVAAAAFVFALPKLMTLITHADEVLATTQTLAAAVGDFVEETRPMIDEVSELASNANGVILENTEAVAEAVGKLNDIDIERLNDAINGLASAVQPLARLGELFSR